MQRLIILVLCIGVGSLVACIGQSGKRHYSSNMIDYLYPDQQKKMSQTVPSLSLPIRVGIAFVPDASGQGHESFWSLRMKRRPYTALGEKDRMDLMNRVAEQFKQYSFIDSIELIPTAYLVPRGGFDNLGQIKTMYDVDVMALLSYDQVQHIDEDYLSLSYWTIVGAYVISGEKNSTSTMVDAAVFDIASQKLLFRAPGTSAVKGRATPVNLNEELRVDSKQGFVLATHAMIANLKIQLELFKEKVKAKPEKYKIIHKPGYTSRSYGGGSLGGAFSLLALALGGSACWLARRR